LNTILVLDDEEPIRKIVRITLASVGYTVFEASTAIEALSFLDYGETGLDLLIADVNLLSGPSGVRVALELRSLFPFLRTILISGVPLGMWNDQDAAEWSELPSDSVVVLEKPFHAAELLERVRTLMRFCSMSPWLGKR